MPASTVLPDPHPPPPPPPEQPAPVSRDDEERRRRRWLRLVVRPRVVADPDGGLRLELTVSNRGPVALRGRLSARVRGRTLELEDPSFTVAAERGPVTLSYRLTDTDGLSPTKRVRATFRDEAGRSITLVGAGTVSAAFGMVAVAALPLPWPPPGPPTLDVPLPAVVVVATEPGAAGNPLGVAAPVELRLGPPVDVGDDEVERHLALVVGDARHDLGIVALPATVVVDQPDPEAHSDVLTAVDVALPADTPTATWCVDEDTGVPVGGYRAVAPGELAVALTLAVHDELTATWAVDVAWRGDAGLEHLPSVDAEAYADDEDPCLDVMTSHVTWSTGVRIET